MAAGAAVGLADSAGLAASAGFAGAAAGAAGFDSTGFDSTGLAGAGAAGLHAVTSATLPTPAAPSRKARRLTRRLRDDGGPSSSDTPTLHSRAMAPPSFAQPAGRSRRRGSTASRIASPRKLKARTVIIVAKPGASASQGCVSR